MIYIETVIRIAFCFILVIASQGRNSFAISTDDISHLTTGAIKTEVELKPSFLNFGEVERGKTLTKTLKLIGINAKDLHLEQSETSEDYFVNEISLNNTDNQSGVIIDVILKPDAPTGIFVEKMTLHTNLLSKPRICVPIYGNIIGAIRAKPKMALLGVIDKRSNATSKLNVTSIYGKKFNILKVIPNPSFLLAEITKAKNGCEYEITLKVDEDTPEGRITGRVSIHTDDPDQSLLEVFTNGLVTDSISQQALDSENSFSKRNLLKFEHIYITQPPIEADTYLSAWLIKRFIDPNAEFVFVPIGLFVPDKTGHIFDLPSPYARWIRTNMRSTSEHLLTDMKEQSPAIKIMVNLARQLEMGSWLVSPTSDAGRLRSTIAEMTSGITNPQLRINLVFTYFDEIYAAGGLIPK